MMDSVVYYLYEYWFDVSDPRTKHFILLNARTPWILIWWICSYALYAKYLGPRLMQNHPPFQLRLIMLIYNTAMAMFNAYSFIKALTFCDYGFRFLAYNYPDLNNWSQEDIYEIHCGYLYWLTKFMDLTDTFIFVLRKKKSQITLLHLYHHSVVPIFGFLILTHNPLIPGGILFAIINSLIHVLMYGYYALSALGPQIQKYLWWKKYITVMQLWQFVVYGMYALILAMFQTGYPPVWMYLGLTQPPLFFYLFYDFYANTYRIKTKRKAVKNE